MSRDKRDTVTAELTQARNDAQAAKDQINGNPDVINALDAIERRVRAIESFLNLDVGNNAD